jgi:stage V sporulation protein SpoVS
MKIPVLILPVVLVLSAGCGDHSSSTPQTTNTAAGSTPASAAGDYAGAMARSQQLAVKTIDTAAINQAIQMFQVEKGRFPKDLNELVENKDIPKIPDTPPGTKLVYDAAAGQVRVEKQ